MTIALQQKNEIVSFSNEQKALIKNYLCKEITDIELTFFINVCQKTGLDPMMKQIYAVKRSGQMTIQTAIDGYRLIAERTGRYSPGKESTYTYKDDKLVSATSYVKKQTRDGTWHEVSVCAHFDEYKPRYQNQIWSNMPHVMLAKCAEALALRKAFPNELSGVYTSEEMAQSQTTISDEQAHELQELLDKCSADNQEKMNTYLHGKNINSFYQLPIECYANIKKSLISKSNEYQDFLLSQIGKEA
jgi:phage recombination protein Bet